LHKVRNNQRQGYANKRRVVTNEEEGSEQYGKWPEEDESTQKPPRVLDTWDGELSGVSVAVEASFHESATPLASGIHLLCRNLWSLAFVVLGEPVGPIL
jgi:hypothetical protein